MTLLDPASKLRWVGPKSGEILTQAGILTVAQVVNRIPVRYDDSSRILSLTELRDEIAALPLWEHSTQKFAVRAKVSKVSMFKIRSHLSLTKCVLTDDSTPTGVSAVWFNQPYKRHELHEGEWHLFYGKVKLDGRTLTFQSPQSEHTDELPGIEIGHVAPLYRRVKTVRSKQFTKIERAILETLPMPEYLPQDVMTDFSLFTLEDAYRAVHAPEKLVDVEGGLRRLMLQELVELKQRYLSEQVVQKTSFAGQEVAKTIASAIGEVIPKLPFTLTKSQDLALEKSVTKLANGERLDSFVYGDVGSGKTIVALLLAYGFIKAGYSVIMAAPTGILAEQHVKTAQKFLHGFVADSSIVLVSGKSARGKLDAGKPTLFIGTHALLFREFFSSEKIALSVIDEQHRFGVQQRQALVKDRHGHVITLSATPIPRTLALSFLGFNDTIDLPEKPQGRKETITKVVPFGKEVATYEWIVKKLEAGERVYMVFPRVLDEEDGEKNALLSMAEQLKTEHFSRFPSAVLYGNMKEEDKTATMQNFASGKTQLLFATTVIEVGVDVPEATVVAVHDATNFGLAQLHQLRGRVGRSDKQGYCFLFSGQRTEEQETRLAYFAAHADGISVAEYDLKSRGAGKLLGSIQSGETELRIASLENIPMVKEAMDLFDVLKKKRITIPNLILAV